MMSFCKKSVHSLLGLASPMNVLDSCSSSSTSSSDHKPSCKCLPDGGLGLVTATGLTLRIPNVLESTTMKSSPSSSSPGSSCKKDPGGIGFIDDIGGGVDGLMSCTESLGFESSDERRVDDEIESMSSSSSSSSSSTTVKWRKAGERRRDRDKVKKFPPPITSLNHNGHPNFFLRPVRRDGRLELTEVRIDRPEILRAFREDGRLRLHLITHEEEDEVEGEQLEHEQEVVDRQDDNENVNEEEEKEEEKLGEWSFPVTGDGFRRCHDHHNQRHSNHHHNLHVWTPHCVTTR